MNIHKLPTLKQLYRLLRISHWSKAAFVLLGVVYSGDNRFWPLALLAALAFCLTASAVYVYNDIKDLEEDRAHPHKNARPLATGELPIAWAIFFAMVFLISGLLIGYYLSTALAALLGLYLLINLAYNHGLKKAPILDVGCIAAGFMLRVLSGTMGIGLYFSWWLIWTATLLSLFIALCKRQLEKQLSLSNTTRVVLRKYSQTMLDYAIYLTALATFIVYGLYIYHVHEASFDYLLTLPFVALGLGRFITLCTRPSMIDDPVFVFLNDKVCIIIFLCFIGLTFVGS